MTVAPEVRTATQVAAPTLRIGTSGWVYRHWKGIFYPERVPTTEELPLYTQYFNTVEVNLSFYRLPERHVCESWWERTPEGFVFAVKGSRYLTHVKKLKDPEEPLMRLMERAGGLGEKLGPILFQLPPTFTCDLDRLTDFLCALRRYRPQRFAFEFRHPSWLVPEVFETLEAVQAALCIPVSPHLPVELRLTAPWTYLRLHGGSLPAGGYTEEELRQWAERVAEFRDRGADAYVYFNNDWEGHAIRNAQRFRQLLSA
jgi:uncharacterized protein YecE (DUF72 family)